MKKTISSIISLIMILSTVFCVDFSAYAATVTVNSKNVTIYTLDSNYADEISIPSELDKQFQLSVSGAKSVSYSVVSGEDYITVSKTGLIKPVTTTWYYYSGGYWSTWPPSDTENVKTRVEYENGDAVVRVKADSETIDVNVHSVDYAAYYANQVMDDYIKENVKSSMSDYEKVCLAAKFAADYEYSSYHSGAVSMIVFGGGDCWASTDAIIKLCKKMGFDAWSRNGNKDYGAGSGHMNAMVKVTDGTYYEVEAGFYEPAPRGYWVTKRTSLFSTHNSDDGVEVYQYDGKTVPENLVIPEKIDGKDVTAISERFLTLNDTVKTITLPDTVKTIGESAFNSCSKLESINFPKSLKNLGDFVFTACTSLKTIKNSSSDFVVSNGVIYNKDNTELLYAPAVSSITVPSTVKTIGFYSFYHNYNLKSITIPDSVTLIKEGAFGDCTKLSSVIINGSGLQKIENFAFANCDSLKAISLPKSVSEIEDNAFYNIENSVKIYGYAGTATETFAKENKVVFSDMSNGCPHMFDNGKITKQPTCTSAGTKIYTCTECGETKTETIAKTAHTYKTTTTKATASKNGSVVTKCTVCGNVSKNTTIYYPKTITLSKTNCVYNGKVQKPTVTVKGSDGKVISSSDYTVAYASGRKNVGKYSVKITFKGNYSGSKILYFTINPKATTISKVTAGKKAFTVKWKKQAAQTTGYEIQYATDSKFTKNKKAVTVSKNSTTSKTISKLSAKKKYYVRIRTYKTVKVNGKSTKIYSSWSKAKTVTTKK